MAFLVVVTGPPGAGKSMAARALAGKFDRSVLVAGDAFFGFLARGAIAPWQPAAHRQNGVVVRAAAAATGRFVAGGYNTVYDGVLGPARCLMTMAA
jgi:dephospho-CoA kinase